MEDVEIKDIDDPKKLSVTHGKIEIDNISFQYKDKPELFDGLSLKINSGETIGLVGSSGGGKSTLVKCLLRVVEPKSGQIRIDDQDISCVKRDDLRNQIIYVPQEALLFHRSIEENIRYSNSQAKPDEIKQAAASAHADSFIKDLPNGFQSIVGERGATLSGGQRQRIALARAFLKDSPIVILDEPTSALDSESEEYIQDSLKKLFSGKTVIVIAHRLSTIAHLDRIIVMNHGSVVEQGSHKELLELKGTYYNLWQRQSKGFI